MQGVDLSWVSLLMMATVVEPAISLKQPKSTSNKSAGSKICWIGEKRSPYQADIQVELMHLQAEADALLIKLQAQTSQSGLLEKS